MLDSYRDKNSQTLQTCNNSTLKYRDVKKKVTGYNYRLKYTEMRKKSQ